MKSLEHQCLDYWRSKPANEQYCVTNIRACATGQFITDVIGGEPCSRSWNDANGDYQEIPDNIFDAAVANPQTFGAAAERLEKLLAS